MSGMGWLSVFLPGCCVVLGVLILLALLRAARGPRFTDRIVAINLIGTMTILIMCILSVYFEQAFLVDIAIVYALLSCIAIVVLTRLVIVRRRAQEERELREKLAGQAATSLETAKDLAPGLAKLVETADDAEKER
ncbi:MAG TPA: monovalent cation/H+ antiporter complex subunit F [Clostridia bacterium]|nr:monovalent cation/H+ antiporter complex subunit F [Clostridia bacterium]